MNRVESLMVRWSGLMLACAFALRGQGVEAAVSMLVALEQVVAWRTRLPRPWEVLASLSCLFAAVSSFLLLYERIPWWDVPVHILTTGALAVLLGWVLRRGRLRPGVVVVCGLVLAVVWEVLELWGHVVIDPTVYVAPWDTVLDVASGVVGAVIAGVLWGRWLRRSAEGRMLAGDAGAASRGRAQREDRLDR